MHNAIATVQSAGPSGNYIGGLSSPIGSTEKSVVVGGGAIGRLADACNNVNRLQESACKIADVLEKKVAALHGPRPVPGPTAQRATEAGGGFDALTMKLETLEGFLDRLANLANQV